jgi:CheY-like chemotaxis protein
MYTSDPLVASTAGLRSEKSVLIVDSDQQERTELALILKALGCKVLEASDALEATLLAVADPGVDFVILAHDLPVIDGCELSEILRQVRPAASLIVLSNSGAVPLEYFHACLTRSPAALNAGQPPTSTESLMDLAVVCSEIRTTGGLLFPLSL